MVESNFTLSHVITHGYMEKATMYASCYVTACGKATYNIVTHVHAWILTVT